MNIVIVTDSYYPDMSATSACMDKYIQKLKYKHSIDIICPISRVNFEPLKDPFLRLHYVSNWMWTLRMKCKDDLMKGRNKKFNMIFWNFFRIRSFLLCPFYYPTIMKWKIDEF